MNSQTISTAAFVGATLVLAGYVFKFLEVKHALLIGGGLLAVGFITQPSTSTSS
jgi:hypothetical protein